MLPLCGEISVMENNHLCLLWQQQMARKWSETLFREAECFFNYITKLNAVCPIVVIFGEYILEKHNKNASLAK